MRHTFLLLRALIAPLSAQTEKKKDGGIQVRFLAEIAPQALGKLGTAQLILKSGQSQISRPEGAKENAYYDVAFAARDQAGVDKVISSSRWPVEQHTRSYLFFFNDANGKVSFRSVDEYLDAPAAKVP